MEYFISLTLTKYLTSNLNIQNISECLSNCSNNDLKITINII